MFGAKSGLKKKKTGGLSNREKDKRKRLPFAARSGQVGGTERAGWTLWMRLRILVHAAHRPRCDGGTNALRRLRVGGNRHTARPATLPGLRLCAAQVKKRLTRNKMKSSKNFKGHQRN